MTLLVENAQKITERFIISYDVKLDNIMNEFEKIVLNHLKQGVYTCEFIFHELIKQNGETVTVREVINEIKKRGFSVKEFFNYDVAWINVSWNIKKKKKYWLF